MVSRSLSVEVGRAHDVAEFEYLVQERAAIKEESGAAKEQAEDEALAEVVRSLPPCLVRRVRPRGFGD